MIGGCAPSLSEGQLGLSPILLVNIISALLWAKSFYNLLLVLSAMYCTYGEAYMGMAYCYECARPLFSHWVSSLFNMVKCLFPYSFDPAR